MAKFYPNLVEKSTVVDAKAITTPLMTQNKVHVEELSATFDWVPEVEFTEDSLNYDVIQVTAFSLGRLIKVGKTRTTGSTLTLAQIATQLGGTNILLSQEVAIIKFPADVTKNSNISVSISSFGAVASPTFNDIPDLVSFDFQSSVDEDGIVVLKIRNESDLNFEIPYLHISIVELRK